MKYKEDNMPTESSIRKVAQAWCTPKTRNIPMDTILEEVFADILDEVNKHSLGNATTAELLDELRARCEANNILDYRTTGEN